MFKALDKFIRPHRKIRPKQQRPIPCSWTNTKKRCPFHHRGLGCKSKMSRDTWSNRQVWPWSTKWSRAKVNTVLPRECTSHSKHTLPTTQEMTLNMDITRWSILKSDWLFAAEDGEALNSQQKQDQELTVAQIISSLLQNSRLKLKKVGKLQGHSAMT